MNIEAILNPIDLSDILQKCVDDVEADQYSVLDAVVDRYSEADEFSSDELIDYLKTHYTIEVETIIYDRIYTRETKIRKVTYNMDN